jgi:hypothetical protein
VCVCMRAKQTAGKCVSLKAPPRGEIRTLKCSFFLISAQHLCFSFKFRWSRLQIPAEYVRGSRQLTSVFDFVESNEHQEKIK